MSIIKPRRPILKTKERLGRAWQLVAELETFVDMNYNEYSIHDEDDQKKTLKILRQCEKSLKKAFHDLQALSKGKK